MTATAAGAAVVRLVEIMDRLRSPGGCPWDADQTHASLVEYLIEETYETVDAIDRADMVALREELGDLLLQVVFHARIAEEATAQPWGLEDVATDIADKLVRRHPHVFEGMEARDTASAEARWHARKAAEKGRRSAADGVPMGMPGLQLVAKLSRRAASAGLAVEPGSRWAVAEASRVMTASASDPNALGDLVVALVVASSRDGIDLDAALRAAVRRYREEIIRAERADESPSAVT